MEEARALYWEDYWKAARCDLLPAPLNVVVFDVAVNSGPGFALRMLQEVLGVSVTGRWDRRTQAALEALQPSDLRDVTERLLNLGERFYRQRVLTDPTQLRYWRGWLGRVARLREYCREFWGTLQ